MKGDLVLLLGRLERAKDAWGLGLFDADLARALGAEVTTTHGRMGCAYRNVPWARHPSSSWQSLPRWSRSLDETVRLVNQRLPVEDYDTNGTHAAVWLNTSASGAPKEPPPRSRCCAPS